MTQLVLPIKLNQETNFDLFIPGANEELVLRLKKLLTDKVGHFIYLWGRGSIGKTHLLQATCQQAIKLGQNAFYLDLADYAELQPNIFEALEHQSILCLDNIDAVAGLEDWEEALFYLYNRVSDLRHSLIVAATKPTAELPWHLQDLRSRLTWGLTYHLLYLTDAEKMQALHLHASIKGMRIDDEVWQYVFKNHHRDMGHLISLLSFLEEQSLIQQKRVTIPFVKSVMLQHNCE